MRPACDCPNLAFYGVPSQTAQRHFLRGCEPRRSSLDGFDGRSYSLAAIPREEDVWAIQSGSVLIGAVGRRL